MDISFKCENQKFNYRVCAWILQRRACSQEEVYLRQRKVIERILLNG